MKLRVEQLGPHLSKHFAALYMIHGDEPLLVQEAADTIRHAARERGFVRECLTFESDVDWVELLRTSASLSLFTSRRLLELRMGSTKIGDAGTRVLQTYVQSPPEDVVLLLICDKLDQGGQRSAWFRGMESAGVVVQVWPVTGLRLPAWIERRMRARGMQPTPEAVALLAERLEGNLLAAAQEIDRLGLLFSDGPVTVQQVQAVVGDSARYSVFDLVDAALAGNAVRSTRILEGLRAEGIDAILVLWALHREIRLLSQLNFNWHRGQSPEDALSSVWEKRKALLRNALGRMTTSGIRSLLHDCAGLDRIIKGLEQGDPWMELLNLSLRLAGRKVPEPLPPLSCAQ